MTELQPINQHVLLDINPADSHKKTASGLFLPESAAGKDNSGRVVGIGAIDNAEIAVGDRVLYKAYSGNEIEFDGKKYLLIPYADILGKIVETEAI